ncbi:CHASE4 domain-containing protein, partial [Rhizobium leguminosarum]|uniref:CHASE4 domain-containing protein n=1 Tax=Rhizobium leguminosarum TaxID=384 RepID=UPI003F977BC1
RRHQSADHSRAWKIWPPYDEADRFAICCGVNLVRLEGRPTIVGVVAINEPDEGQRQTMRQFLIVVRFIDGAALDELSRQQGLNGARFARTADA